MKKFIAQFIPILLIFFLFSFIKPFIEFSNTIAGKLIAISIIIFYTYLDKILGLFVCSLVILFYHMNMKEGYEGMEDINIDHHLISEIIDPETNSVNIIDAEIYLDKEDKTDKKYPKGISAYRFTEYDESSDALKEEFRKENCKGRELMYKNNKVNNEMAEFVFPELKMGEHKCNACDKGCRFSIIESKLSVEKELTPKSSWLW
jgi:hypothetical protein